jgi:2-succinyl-5-enolpyruvyl-6-hydroxy-3-cyclohexene-1-carboxylate synthase
MDNGQWTMDPFSIIHFQFFMTSLRYQFIYDLVETCSKKGVIHTVICPGSRSAPLTLAFANHPNIKCFVIPDERSAAFVALGISQSTGLPVALVCTSGSAAYNFAPAVAEAFFQHIPLLVFTADRPPEMIDQLDGQTIRQKNLYGPHVKQYFELPVDESSANNWFVNRTINEAINLVTSGEPGPVQLNVPFREPFYPQQQEPIVYNNGRVIDLVHASHQLTTEQIGVLKVKWKSHKKILIVGGQSSPSNKVVAALQGLLKKIKVPVIGELLSNLHAVSNVIQHAELFLGQGPDELKETLRPELLITFGQSLISKNVKLFLRKYPAIQHWHIQAEGDYADTFQNLTTVLRCSPEFFFENIPATEAKETFRNQKQNNYYQLWQAEEHRAIQAKLKFCGEVSGGEFNLVRNLMESLPSRCNLHLANSMSVRYANLVTLAAKQKGIRVFSNRGTSGIDGCTSTVVGHCLASEVPNILITGDMAFFYDRNAFWHNYAVPNLRVAILNNHGGIIFKMIDGPAGRHEGDVYFVTRQQLTAKSLAGEFGMSYDSIDHPRRWKNSIKNFFDFNGKAKILELESNQEKTIEEFNTLKNIMKKSYD